MYVVFGFEINAGSGKKKYSGSTALLVTDVYSTLLSISDFLSFFPLYFVGSPFLFFFIFSPQVTG
jgi:hypothetical protein